MFTYISLEAPLSGMSMNPARTFGSALPGHLWTALWIYFTQDWLRLALPMPNDTNRTRWPTHPLWAQITGVFDQQARLDAL